LTLLLAILWAATPGASERPARAQTAQPNIVIIMTDDQRWDSVTTRYMPRLMARMVPGTNAVFLTEGFVSNPLCCPSRVTTLTGTYASTTGVYANEGSFTGPAGTGGGGFASFNDDPAVHPTIATDLHTAGYRTGLIGKYLNGYPGDSWAYTPPGWDRWFSVRTGAYFDYDAATDGRLRHLGTSAREYSTRVLTRRAIAFASNAEAAGSPFFLYFALTAPHGPATPDPIDVGRFDADVAGYVHPTSVGEQDTSDKPAYIAGHRWSPTIQQKIDAFHAAQLNTSYGADRAFARVWDALPDNTVVLFTSDNGFLWGEHRWEGKTVPYNESVRVPMIVATKGLGAPSIDPSRIALNVDIRATLEGFAGLTPATDGLDWMDPTWRRPDFVLEHWNATGVPTYCGVRSTDRMYARYSTGEEELYDESLDPLELDNMAAAAPPELAAMRARAQTLCTSGQIYPPDWPF
jgi:arylsulfatase A-like enzyme